MDERNAAGQQPDRREDPTKLRAELAILRSQLRKLEKENSDLRSEKSSFFLAKHEEEKELKRRLNIYQKEYQIRSAQNLAMPAGRLSATQPPPDMHGAKHSSRRIGIQYALKFAVNPANLESPEEINKLRFFRDYFFDDFYSIAPEAVVRAITESSLNASTFVEVFKLFCCHRAVFEAFYGRLFETPFFRSDKISIIESLPIDWIVDALATGDSACAELKKFIAESSTHLFDFFGNVAETRPSLLHRVLLKEGFEQALRAGTAASRRLVTQVCKNGGLGYVDEKNLGCFSEQDLSLCFGSDFYGQCDCE